LIINIKENDMSSKVDCKAPCANQCPCGWFNKRVFGVTVGVWLIAFAILPHSARGISWSARSIAGLWDDGVRAVGVDRPVRTQRLNRVDFGD
tara:strand:+ start:35614 stop:35889 length:276 start_codon:yes stop_codon:yes gene_type:complete